MGDTGVRRRTVIGENGVIDDYYDEEYDENDDFVETDKLKNLNSPNKWKKTRKPHSFDRQMQYSMKRLSFVQENTGGLTTAQLVTVVGISSVIMIFLVLLNYMIED